MHLFDLIEIYAYGTCKDLVRKKGKTKCTNKIKYYKKWSLIMLEKIYKIR